MKRTIFMTAWDMDVEKGGINKVMLQRSALFSNKDYRSVLLTMDFKMNYHEIASELRATGQLSKDVDIINVNDYYREKFASKEVSSEQKERYEQAIKKYEGDYWVQDAGSYARYFMNGTYIKYKQWDDDGVLKFIDYFDENRVRIRKEEFHRDGYKIRETLYHPANNKKNQERYFTPDGFCFLTMWFNHENGKQQRIYLFDPSHKKVEDFNNRVEFHRYWLEELCRTEVVKPVVIVDEAATAERVIKMDDDLAYKIYMLHSNHFEEPYTLGSPYRNAVKPILDIIPKGYPVVVLTEQQQMDLHKEIGNRGNVLVIPNCVELPVAKVEKDPLLVSLVARYTKDKRIDQAIEAFLEVARDVPGAKLEIYGAGDEEDELKKLIKKLKVHHSVKLKDYTNRMDEVFAKSAVSLVTSKAEGLSLAMLESLANRTPVVSYEINYGPAQVIKDGETGYLVPDGDIEALADRIKKLLENPDDAKRMGDNAFNLIKESYTPEIYYDKWRDLIEQTIAEDKQKPLL
ncbi:glycosyltransferase [Rummeliibacillus sp. NPDC094406]|uniref:glycosyltransferase n=1 Tax=Rummeliibacillus sp. NPDC094406 TaxID=3364511 RepID=UPI00382C9B2B